MADDMNMDGISRPESAISTRPDDNNPTVCQQLMIRLEQLKTLPTTTKTSKEQVWLQFIALWCEVLQIPPSDVKSCYDACARLLPFLFKSADFYSIRKDLHVARDNFSRCIDQLDQPRLKDYILLTNEEQKLPANRMYHSHVYYLLMISAQTALYLPFATIEDLQYVDNHVQLFTLLIDRVEQSMPEHSPTAVENGYALGAINERILGLLWNLADRTVLVPTLLKCGLAKRIVGWLSQSAMLTEKGRRPLISIAHNLARHDDGADELNKHGAIEVIKHYQNIKLEKVDSRILVCSMALALLSTPEQLKRDKKGMNVVLNQLLQLVMDASQGDRHRHDGFHVSEPLGVMVKMFVVEERTLDYVLCHAETEPPSDIFSTIRLFVSLLFEFREALKGTDRLEQFTLIALLNILWSISFQPTYVQELSKDQQFLATIKQFTDNHQGQEILEQYKPRSMEGVKEAVNGILHNLNVDNKTADQNRTGLDALVFDPPGGGKPWIMVSYSHDNGDFCDRILDLFATRNDAFEVWVDRTHCQTTGDLWESIADGMEQASVIVCLVSSQYFQSKSCRKEFIYAADSLKKTIVPVLLDNFEPKGWLGIRMPGIKYVRFRDLTQPDQAKMTELLNTVLSSLSASLSVVDDNLPPAPRHHSIQLPARHSISPFVPTVAHETIVFRPFEQWTSGGNDIHAWFAHNRISKELRDLFGFETGEEMLDYAQLLIKDREKQMNIYAKVFAQTYNGKEMAPHEFNRFARALEQLLKDNPPSPTKPNPSVPIKSTTCALF